MNSPLKENFVTTKDAGEFSGYTSDYLARLVRSGEIVGKRVGHSWFIEKGSLECFLENKKFQKMSRARELAQTRAEEYRAHSDRAQKNAPMYDVSPKEFIFVQDTIQAHMFALSVACALVISGSVVARAEVLPQFLEQTTHVAQEVAFGFGETFGDVPAKVQSEYLAVLANVQAAPLRIAPANQTAFVRFASLVLAEPDLSLLRMDIPTIRYDRAPSKTEDRNLAAVSQAPAASSESLRVVAQHAYAVITHPIESVSRAYGATGRHAYTGIQAVLSGYVSFIERVGVIALDSGVIARDRMALMPNMIVHLSLLPREVGDFLAYRTAEAPRVVTNLYAKATTAPAVVGPVLARGIFGAEYAGATRFVAITNSLSGTYLSTITGAGNSAYAGAENVRSVALALGQVAGKAENAYLGALGNAALAFEKASRTSFVAAALTASEPALSTGEKAALATYRTIHGLFQSTTNAVTSLFSPDTSKKTLPPPALVAVPDEAPVPAQKTVVPVAVPQIVRQTVNSYPTYTTTTLVQGVSENLLNQKLSTLRSDILSTTAGLIQPVAQQGATNATTIQYVNMIQDLSNLIVRNGDFRGGTFDGGVVSNASSITGATGTFASLAGAAVSSLASNYLPKWNDNTFTNSLVYDNGTYVGIGTTTPSYALDVSGTINATNLLVGGLSVNALTATSSTMDTLVLSSAGRSAVLSIDASGNVLGTSTPTAASFFATSTSVASVFPLASTTLLSASDSAYLATSGGRVGIGTTTPDAVLSVLQRVNGIPIMSVYRATDIAPSGDFINYKSAAGAPLFRVDNSGNLMAGGIINTGSQTITSTSQPQFRVQYDASNEWTASTDATGATTFGINGSAPSLAFTPFSNSVNTFNFTNALASNSILSVDTQNQRVGINTATPAYALDVTGPARFTSLVDAAHFVATSSTATSLFNGHLTVNGDSLFANATTTNLFSTTASSTNLFASIAQLGSLTLNTPLAIASGGTGVSSFTPNQMLYTGSAGTLLSVATTSLNLAAAAFSSPNISQWFNDAAYGATTTNNTWAGTQEFTNASSTQLSVSGNTYLPLTGILKGNGAGNALTVAANGTDYTLLTTQTCTDQVITALTAAGGSTCSSVSNAMLAGSISPTKLSLTKGYFMVGDDAGVAQATSTIFISSTGNVGIGTTTSSANTRLAVVGNSMFGNTDTMVDGAQVVGIQSTSNIPGLWVGGNSVAGQSQGIKILSGLSSSDYSLNAADYNGNSLLYVRGDGNIGIGTTTPLSRLEIVGSSQAATDSSQLFELSTGTGALTDEKLLFGINDGSYAWMQAIKAGTNYRSLSFNPIGGNVGIGSTAPVSKLNIALSQADNAVPSTATLADSFLHLGGGEYAAGRYFLTTYGYATGRTNPGAYIGALGVLGTDYGKYDLVFGTRDVTTDTLPTERMRITTAGNIGIGTINPLAALNVRDSHGSAAGTSPQGALFISDVPNGLPYGLDFGISYENGGVQQYSWMQSRANSSATYYDLALNPVGGNVGIGTTTPGAPLAVQSASNGLGLTINGTSGVSPTIRLTNNGNQVGKFAAIANANDFLTGTAVGDVIIGNDNGAGKLHLFGGGNSIKMTIDTTGNVGIGTTTPAAQLHIEGTGGIGILQIGSNSTNQYQYINFGGNVAGNNAWQIGKADASGDVASNGGFYIYDIKSSATRFTIASTTGNVGIGTTTPNSSVGTMKVLHISDSSSSGLHLTGAGDGNLELYNGNGNYLDAYGNVSTGANNFIAFRTEETVSQSTPTERMRITSGGNVGIGTTSPLSQLEISQISGGQVAIVRSDGAADEKRFDIYNAGAYLAVGRAVNDAQDAVLASGISIARSGNVGIGTTSPGVKLHVVGGTIAGQTAAVGGVIGATTQLESVNTNGAVGDWSGIRFNFFNEANGISAPQAYIGAILTSAGTNGLSDLAFGTRASAAATAITEYMRIQGGGNVGIGTTSPATLLEVGGAAANVTFDFYKSCTGFTSDANGKLLCTASDQRLKQDITPLATSTVLAGINALSPVSFYWNPSTGRGPARQFGLIAQQVREVFPNLVNTTSPTELTPDGTLVVNYEGLIAPMILAVQQLDAKFSVPAGATSTPAEVLTVDGKGIDVYKLATYAVAAATTASERLGDLDMRMTSLEERVVALEGGSVASASDSPITFSTTSLASALEGFGVLIQKGIAQFNTLVFRQLVASKDADGTSSAGSVTILSGNTVAQVNNSLVKSSTKVFVTFNSQITGSWWVSDKLDGSFRVVLSAPQAGDVSFDYFLVQTEGQLADSSTSSSSGVSQSNGPDTVAPVITLLGSNPLRLSVGDTFAEPGVTVVDEVDGSDPYSTFVNGIEQEATASTIDTAAPTTYIITYKVADAAGNIATAIRSVIVGNADGAGTGSEGGTTATVPASGDTTPPVVTVTGAAAMQIVVGDVFVDPGATATDDTDGDLTAHLETTGTVDATTEGLYTLHYSATDAAGNTASVSRVVTVVAPPAEPAP